MSADNVMDPEPTQQPRGKITRQKLLENISAGIPTVITGKEALGLSSVLPRRSDFVDQKLSAAFLKRAERETEGDAGALMFCPNTIVEKDDYNCAFEGGSRGYAHRIYLFGIMPCGSKAAVVLTGIPVYCDVRCVDKLGVNVSPATFIQRMKALISVTEKCEAKEFRIVNLFPCKEFSAERVPYCRIFFDARPSRRNALNAIQAAGYQTASDDVGGEGTSFNMLAREYKFSTAGWNRVTDYRRLTPYGNLACILEVDVKNFRELSAEKRSSLNKTLSDAIARDRLLEAQWDIETRSREENGRIPTPGSRYDIICINTWYTWYSSAETPVVSVAVTDMYTEPEKRMGLVVCCEDEKEILAVHFTIMGLMAPDILSAFNGSNFDWPLVRDRASRYNILLDMQKALSAMPVPAKADSASVYKWCFTSKKVKLENGNDHDCKVVLNIPGILDIDSQPMFLKMNTRAEVSKQKSLNFFLESAKLPSKEDMHFKRMFRVYERSVELRSIKSCHCDIRGDCSICCTNVKEIDYKTSADSISEPEYSNELYEDVATKCCYCSKRPRNYKDVADVLYYCTIDCKRPHQLFVKKALIDDKRALANMAFVTLADAFYRADGQKVNNLIGRFCAERGYAYSAKAEERHACDKEHYPGAWVFPPNKGLHADGIVKVMVLKHQTDPLAPPVFIFVDKQGRPIVGLDFASLYPSLMMAYGLSTDRVVKSAEQMKKLTEAGYVLAPIVFDYEVGEKKGMAGNRHYKANGWVVRHNNVMKPGDNRKRWALCDVWKSGDKEVVVEVGKEPADTTAPPDPSVKPTRCMRLVDDGPSLPGECMGIFPSVVKEIFDRRVPVKAEWGCYGKHKEMIKKSGAKTIDVKLPNGTIVPEMTLDDIEFMENKVNAQQKALKLIANTFYGASGDNRNPIYEMLVAGGVTSAGQYNIKLVAKFVADNGFGIHYGDTDSLYISSPDEIFKEEDLKYIATVAAICAKYGIRPPRVVPGINFGQESDNWSQENYDADKKVLSAEAQTALQDEMDTARLAWWEVMVAMTMKSVNELNAKVTEMLINDNGTAFLKMAYEEVCYPTLLCGKKKYCAIAHMQTINFKIDPEDVFIRGIEFIKRGQAKKSKQMGYEIIGKLMSYKNYKGPLEVVEEILAEFHEEYSKRALTVEEVPLFTMFGQYKPDKKNVPIRRFVARMTEAYKLAARTDKLAAEMYAPPDAGDKFEFVMTAKPQEFTLDGKKIALAKGDFMEYTHVYFKDKHELDVDWYVRNQFIGTMARFACSDVRFLPSKIPNLLDKEAYKSFDKSCVDAASDYITAMYDKMVGFNKKDIATKGLFNKKVFREVQKAIDENLKQASSSVYDVLEKIRTETEPGARSWLLSKFDVHVAKTCSEESLLEEANKRVAAIEKRGDLRRSIVSDSVVMTKIKNYASSVIKISKEINEISPTVSTIYLARETRMKDSIMKLRDSDLSAEKLSEYAQLVNSFTEEEIKVLEKVNELGVEYIATQSMWKKELMFLKRLKSRRIEDIDAVPGSEIVPQAVAADFKSGLGVKNIPNYEFK